MNESSPLVSVIVPVLDDVTGLSHCLQALNAQTYASDKLEVIVVDNGSNQRIQSLCEQYAIARYVLEEQRGSYAARNAGLQVAKGEVIAFTDADCKPATSWLAQGVYAVTAHRNVGVVGGKIDMEYQQEKRPNLYELYDRMCFLNQELCVERGFAVTGNMFTRREVFDAVGLFDATLRSGADKLWCWSVATAGYRVVYAPAALVKHPARGTYQQLAQKWQRIFGGQYQIRQKMRGMDPAEKKKLYLPSSLKEICINCFLKPLRARKVLPNISWVQYAKLLCLHLFFHLRALKQFLIIKRQEKR